MSQYTEELKFLIHQFLEGEECRETIHMLEKESGLFFNINYFEECVINGDWEEAEKYVSRFTNVDDNPESRDIFFLIRRQKYFEALRKHDHYKALDILRGDLKVFSNSHADLYTKLALCLTWDNFSLHDHEDEKLTRIELIDELKPLIENKTRIELIDELKPLIENNPLLRDKLQFPTFQKSRLQTLIEQSTCWRLQQCKNKGLTHKVKTLFRDHSCDQVDASASSTTFQSDGTSTEHVDESDGNDSDDGTESLSETIQLHGVSPVGGTELNPEPEPNPDPDSDPEPDSDDGSDDRGLDGSVALQLIHAWVAPTITELMDHMAAGLHYIFVLYHLIVMFCVLFIGSVVIKICCVVIKMCWLLIYALIRRSFT